MTSYIGLPTFFVLWAGYKLCYRTRVIPASEVDLISGKREIDEEEEQFIKEEAAKSPRTLWGKLWDGL